MRTLSATLTTAQKAGGRAIIKLELTGASSYTFYGGFRPAGTSTRYYILPGTQGAEQPDNYRTTVLLDNSDNYFTDKDLKGYTAYVSKGYYTSSGAEYSKGVLHKVLDMQLVSSPGKAYCVLYLVGQPNLLAGEPASESYLPTDGGGTAADGAASGKVGGSPEILVLGDNNVNVIEEGGILVTLDAGCSGTATSDVAAVAGSPQPLVQGDNTVNVTGTGNIIINIVSDTMKDIITGTAAGLAYGFPVYDAVTLSWDSEDDLIDVLKPLSFYRVTEAGTSRWASINWCLDWTKEVCRPENDGKLHFLNPTVSGTSYDYQYALSGSHPFFGKTYSKPIVRPNVVAVRNYENTLTGGGVDSSSSLIMYHAGYIFPVTGADQADNIGAAIIQRVQLDSQSGRISVPVNVGQEIWDYVKVTDAREGGSERTGNIQFIHWQFGPDKFSMTIGFGGKGNVLSGGQIHNYGASQVDYIPADLQQDMTNSLFDIISDQQDQLDKIATGMNGSTDVFDTTDTRGKATVPAPTDDTDAATKKYVDDIAIAGVPDPLEIDNLVVDVQATVPAPSADTDAATKKYVDDNYLPLAGGTMSGAIAMGTNKITGMVDPTENQDAATKKYVDDNISDNTGVTASQDVYIDNESGSGRAAGTVYQNTTGHALLVTICFDFNPAAGYSGYADIYVDSASSPVQRVADPYILAADSAVNAVMPLSFIVPAGWYYKVLIDAGSHIDYWTEWTLS